ncbi:hypothetical protein Tco_0252867 [Tanacetum coccineum]
MNHQTLTIPQVIPQVAYQSPQAPTQLMTELPFGDSGFAVPIFSPGDNLIAYLNKAMAFLTAVASSRLPCNKFRGDKGKIILVQHIRAMLLVQGEIQQVDKIELLNATTAKMKDIWLDLGILADQAQTIIPHNAAFQIEDLNMYDSDCDDLSTAQAVLMANISNYGSDIISEAQQDSMILSVIEHMSEQMINHVNNWEKANKEQKNESITVELERYKEKKLALKEQIDSLEQHLSKQIKEKESLFKTFTVFKNESKEKVDKYMENEIDLETKIKELDNIICYQNLFYLRKAQRMKPTLYDGVVLSNTHVVMPMIDDEETLILEEESRSKMFEKAKDPKTIVHPCWTKTCMIIGKSRMELYMQNREHGRMILESVEHSPLIWPTVEENGVIRIKKYVELSAAEKIQADCDMKATI